MLTKSPDRLLILAFALSLFVYGLTGLFAQPVADDLDYIWQTRQYGPVEMMSRQYYGWHGRYSYAFVDGFVLGTFPSAVHFMPGILIALLMLTLWRGLRHFVQYPLVAAMGLTFAFLTALPEIWQSLYWFSGSANYIAPLILGLFILLWFWC